MPLLARTVSPVFKLPATIPELAPTVERVASPVFELPAMIPELPPTVEQVEDGEQHVVGGGGSGKKDGESI